MPSSLLFEPKVADSVIDNLMAKVYKPGETECPAESEHTNNSSFSEKDLTFAGKDVAELESLKDQTVDWVVTGVFGCDQPTVFGAASKSTKTLQLFDLAVALTKPDQCHFPRKWLDYFTVPRRRRVLLITAESNERSVARILAKALKAHSTSFKDTTGYLRVNASSSPKLASVADLAAIAEDVKQHKIDVVILDPLYVALAGLEGNLMEDRGSAIRDFFQAVQPAALILSHHFTKSASRTYGDQPCLEDLTGSGLAESAGNWWLMKRNVPYGGEKKHDLVALYGGRDGQAGTVRIVLDETKWKFTIQNYKEYVQEKSIKAKSEKMSQVQEKRDQEYEQLLVHISKLNTPTAKSNICRKGPVPQTAAATAFERLVADSMVEAVAYKDEVGRNRKNGWKISGAGIEHLESAADEDVEPDFDADWDTE